MKTWATAIKNALTEYNRHATELLNPGPHLMWSEIVKMVSVADFNLLCNARQDVRKFDWADSMRRRATGLYFNIKRAHEEITHLNVEIPRLLTSMIDDHVNFYRMIQAHIITDPPLAYELSLQWQYHDAIYSRMAVQLYWLKKLPGFSGLLQTGHHVGRDPMLAVGVPPPHWAMAMPGNNVGLGVDDGGVESEGEDEGEGKLVADITDMDVANAFIDYVSDMA